MLLPARELSRIAIADPAQADDVQGILDASSPLGLGHAAHLEREREVLGDGQVRKERVVLEDHADIAQVRGKVGDVLVADHDPALGGSGEARHHVEDRRFPGPGRSEQDQELTGMDIEVEPIDGDNGLIPLRDAIQVQRTRHRRTVVRVGS